MPRKRKGLLRKILRFLTKYISRRDLHAEHDLDYTKHEGWLYKKGEIFNEEWTKRWFTLSNFELRYYLKEDSNVPQGSILIKDIQKVSSGRAAQAAQLTKFIIHGDETDNGFVVTTPDRTFALVADTNLQKHEWISILSEEINRIEAEALAD